MQNYIYGSCTYTRSPAAIHFQMNVSFHPSISHVLHVLQAPVPRTPPWIRAWCLINAEAGDWTELTWSPFTSSTPLTQLCSWSKFTKTTYKWKENLETFKSSSTHCVPHGTVLCFNFSCLTRLRCAPCVDSSFTVSIALRLNELGSRRGNLKKKKLIKNPCTPTEVIQIGAQKRGRVCWEQEPKLAITDVFGFTDHFLAARAE